MRHQSAFFLEFGFATSRNFTRVSSSTCLALTLWCCGCETERRKWTAKDQQTERIIRRPMEEVTRAAGTTEHHTPRERGLMRTMS